MFDIVLKVVIFLVFVSFVYIYILDMKRRKYAILIRVDAFRP